jgi:hypothetical protein
MGRAMAGGIDLRQADRTAAITVVGLVTSLALAVARG